MRHFICLFGMLAMLVGMHGAALAAPEQDAEADALLGIWLTEGGKARVEITRDDAKKYSGKIIWLSETEYPADDPEAGKPKRDRENPDKARQNDPIVGSTMLVGFVYNGDGKWDKGTVYDAESGNTYKAKIKLEDRNTLKLRGYVGIAMLGRTTTWTRFEEPAAAL